ncbi:hypothetical protein [Flavobacterium soli]|uniref:hypothetical protein n=1 Tax=Flavobacterium soli TaxID=344881 RepID=UPI000479C14B|nr:hypothetical protein [Flavobacterium soli]
MSDKIIKFRLKNNFTTLLFNGLTTSYSSYSIKKIAKVNYVSKIHKNQKVKETAKIISEKGIVIDLAEIKVKDLFSDETESYFQSVNFFMFGHSHHLV